MQDQRHTPLYRFWTPNYWGAWLGLGLLRLTCWLPYKTQIGLGKSLGRLAHRFAAQRRAITRRNLALAFPNLSTAARNELALHHFEALGASIMEWGLGRWASYENLEKLIHFEGMEHLHHAMKDGGGVILLSAHFTPLEISGRVLTEEIGRMDGVYRKNRSEFMTAILLSGREMSVRRAVEKNDIKSMIRSLREGVPVWYAPDQSYNRKQSAVIPFFGVPAMTNIATSTLARAGRAVAVPYFSHRLPEGGYRITILPPIEGLPSKDPVADTKKFVALLEAQIRLAPEQYYWVHRKYKGLPDPLPDYYADLDAWK
jgi:KDO2-lipid IV(A) lauroyltransferase